MAQKVVYTPTRPGITQRMLVLTPSKPKAAVVLLAGVPGSKIYANKEYVICASL
jgi:hypothetical protein